MSPALAEAPDLLRSVCSLTSCRAEAGTVSAAMPSWAVKEAIMSARPSFDFSAATTLWAAAKNRLGALTIQRLAGGRRSGDAGWRGPQVVIYAGSLIFRRRELGGKDWGA
jgi:hypothetical protein